MRSQRLSGRLAAMAAAVLGAMLAANLPASAQNPAPAGRGEQEPAIRVLSPAPVDVSPRAVAAGDAQRACLGCPERRPFWAIGEVFGINLLYEGVNLAFRSPDQKIYYRTYPKIWWNNLRHGLEWDDNSFMINQWGHPYQGSTYFSAGRSNGLSFWESASLTVLGAMTWEYLAERHKPSMNDLLMTTLGGIALGEVFHRSAWLLRDTMDTGKRRVWREIGAAVFDPVTGINRFIDGDASRIVEKPAAYVPSSISASFDAGLLWRGENLSLLHASGEPFLQASVTYGTPAEGRSTTPFDAFLVDIRLRGGGATISEVRGRGRLTGLPLSGTSGLASRQSLHFMALMDYEYENNSAYQFGGQGFGAALTHRWRFDSTWRLVTEGSGGVLVLGAIDSLYDSGDARQYDFGPGLSYGGSVALMRGPQPLLRADYRSIWLHSLDGAAADHWTQNIRLDLILPIKGRVGFGTTGEFIRRRSYYDEADDVLQRFPQVRVYVSWMY